MGKPLYSFLEYHLARFDHIYIFLDDDDEQTACALRQAGERVTIIFRQDAKQLYPLCPSWDKYRDLDEISVRQILNAEACVNLLLDRWPEGCWLVHIDLRGYVPIL